MLVVYLSLLLCVTLGSGAGATAADRIGESLWLGGGLGLVMGLTAFCALVLPAVFALRHIGLRRHGRLKSHVPTAAQWGVMAALAGAPFIAVFSAGPAFMLLGR